MKTSKIIIHSTNDDKIDKMNVYSFRLKKHDIKIGMFTQYLHKKYANAITYTLFRKGDSVVFIYFPKDANFSVDDYIEDGIHIAPKKEYYSNTHFTKDREKIWINLALRSIAHDIQEEGDIRALEGVSGYGRPLYSFINNDDPSITGDYTVCMDFICSVNKKNDDLIEVDTSIKNVKLRPYKPEDDRDKSKPKILWGMDSNRVLHRIYNLNDKKLIIYEEHKDKNTRINYPYFNLKDIKSFKSSRLYRLKVMTERLNEKLKSLGFDSDLMSLNLKNIKTISKKDSTSKEYNSHIQSDPFYIIDARKGKTSTAVITECFCDLMPDASFIDSTYTSIEELDRNKDINLERKFIVIIDQPEGFDDDPYLKSNSFRRIYPIQHIIMNPNIKKSQIIDKGFRSDKELKDEFFGYTEDDFTKYLKNNKKNLKAKLANCMKELMLKKILIRNESLWSVTQMKNMKDISIDSVLTYIKGKDVVSIHQGYPSFYTFHDTEFNTLMEDKHGLNLNDLIDSLVNAWPYDNIETIIEGYMDDDAELDGVELPEIILLDQSLMYLKNPSRYPTYSIDYDINRITKLIGSRNKKIDIYDWMNAFEAMMPIIKNYELNDDSIQKMTLRCEKTIEFLKALSEEKQSISFNEISDHKLKKDYLENNISRVNPKIFIDILSDTVGMELNDPRALLKEPFNVFTGISADYNNGYIYVGSKDPIQTNSERFPSIQQWLPIKGDLDIDMLASLYDVNFVRYNSFAGKPFMNLLLRLHKEIQ